MTIVLPRGGEVMTDTVSMTVSPETPSMATLTPLGSITLAVAGEAPEAISGKTSTVLKASIARMFGSPSLAVGYATHSLDLDVIGLSFEAPIPEGPTSAASPSESSEMTK